MAKSNRDRVGEVLIALKEGLGPFVLREYKMVFKSKYLDELERVLSRDLSGVSSNAFASETNVLRELDVAMWLKAIIFGWRDVFSDKLGHAERSYASEILNQRNEWAHQQAFTVDDAQRAADTATRMLLAIGAVSEAKVTQQITNDLLRLRFEREQERSKKAAPVLDEPPTTMKGLKPWRFVVRPHPDVAEGRYIQAQFAADLAQVVRGEATAEYGDPQEFFRRTYLTEGLIDLLSTGIKRLTGLGGDPVIQLQTSFGGGKTHSMLAMYHLVNGQIHISEIPDGELILERLSADIDDLIEARFAVLVGTAFSATEPRVYDDVTTHTLWGDMAYQLGGVEGYRMVEQADLNGVSPGSDTIKQLLEAYGPCLIMIDELVAFARNLYHVADPLPAGSFDSVMTFMQTLTEAVKRSSDSMLLVSIPESDIEIGGEGGKRALDILSKTIGRIEAVWKPVTANESFEIVRRRLFSSDIDYAARDAVITEFREMYARNKSEYPSGVSDKDYMDRMRAAYPIHPELFDRLYQDWSTLDRFQKTRGVLRLMASVIHELWLGGDQSLMIMPGSIPLDKANVRNEMLRYLPENWPAIVDADIDGDNSRPVQTDRDVPTLGQYSASRRIGRTIFVGSAPSVAAQTVRGVEEVRIYLGTIQPGEQAAIFGDALRRLSNTLTYLYSDGTRYWYDTRPTVNRIAQDRAQTRSEDEVYREALDRLRKVRKNHFAGYHVAPQGSADIIDEWTTRVVVLPPEAPHTRNGNGSEAIEFAAEILESRGNAPRLYRNMLVFIAPDRDAASAFESAIREFLAWQSIKDEEELLNLDAQQRKQVKANLERTNETVDVRLLETYSWLIVPIQPDPTGPIEWQAHRISGQDSFYDRAMKKLQQSELLITQWSPYNLDMELEKYLWRDEAHLGVKQLWDYLARYCYLPRLYDADVLIDAVTDGVSRSDAPFAYADMVDGDIYRGLRYQEPGRVIFDEQSVIIRPEVAEEIIEAHRLEAEEQANRSISAERSGSMAKPAARGDQSADRDEPAPALKNRYYGTVAIDPLRVNREVGIIVEEIIERLTSLSDTEVEVILEIRALRRDGFDESTVRTIGENSRTLKFDDYGFEEE